MRNAPATQLTAKSFEARRVDQAKRKGDEPAAGAGKKARSAEPEGRGGEPSVGACKEARVQEEDEGAHRLRVLKLVRTRKGAATTVHHRDSRISWVRARQPSH